MNDSDESIWIEKYFDTIKNYFKDEKYQEFLRSTLEIYRVNKYPPFVFCLSASKDILSQWRAYSQDGQGVCLSFNTKHLKFKQEIPSPNVYAHQTLGLAKVEYYNYSQKNKILEICKKFKKQFDLKAPKGEDAFLSIDFGLAIVNWSLVFKNSNFREEREWRIIHTPGYGSIKYEEPLANLSNLEFRLSQGKIVTYYNYCFDTDFTSACIDEIILGPKCKMNIEEVRTFLEHNNLNRTRITQSKSTYR